MTPGISIGRLTHRRHNPGIGAATAEISSKGPPDISTCRIRVMVQESTNRHDLPRCAEPALKCIVLNEGSLNRIEVFAIGKALDRHDVASLTVKGQDQAGINGRSVQEHRASTALPHVAHLLCPGKLELDAEGIQQCAPGLNGESVIRTVDSQLDRHSPRPAAHFLSFRRGTLNSHA
jgi:hypothetical protein